MKKLYIKTYGCQMNVYDTERMTDVLKPLGYQAVDGPDGADMVILNTCHIREKAADKVFSDLGRIKPLKDAKTKDGSRMILAVAGCVAQAEGEVIRARAPYVDMVFGPQTYHRLPQMVAEATRSMDLVMDTDFPAEAKFDELPTPEAQGPAAFLSVQEGCDKFCTFCVVPYTRGAEYSRPAVNVLKDARSLVATGAREVTLLGQNVNAYHGAAASGAGTWNLARLIRELADIDGLDRIRYTTSHPRDLDDDLIQAHGDVEKLMPYLHLPVQAGSDAVLDAMNRGHTADDYLRMVDALRAARPDLALTSDFIVGFPGETATDFDATMALVDRVAYAGAFSFKYSARPGTPAAAMINQVPEAEKSARLTALQALLQQQQDDFNARCVGLTLPVLLDRTGRNDGQVVGRSPYLQPVYVNGPDTLIGQIHSVSFDALTANSFAGSLSAGTGAAYG